jgi:hypothetical protein
MADVSMPRYFLYELLFPNGKRYLGISKDPALRFENHTKCAAKRTHNYPVYCAMRKYGCENVKLRVLCEGRRDYIAALEVKAIASFGTTNRRHGYNLCLGGQLSPMDSPVIRAKVKKANDILWSDPVFRERRTAELRARSLGTKRTPEQCKRLSEAHKGQRMPEAVRLKMLGRVPSNKGVPATEDFKRKSSEIALARYAARRKAGLPAVVISTEQRKKLSIALMGHPGHCKGRKFPARDAKLSRLRWINNGVKRRRVPKEDPLPSGWVFGRGKMFAIAERLRAFYASNPGKGTNCRWINDWQKRLRLLNGSPLPPGWCYGYKLI